MSCLSRMAGAALLVLPLCVAAHSEGEGGAEEDVYAMDCVHPPKDALKALPDAFAQWARIMCMPTGHMLVQSAGTQWRYPGSFTTKVMFPARSAQDENDGHPRYFTRMEFRQLPDDEARVQHERLLRENALYAGRVSDSATREAPASPPSAWQAVGTNNANVTYEILLMRQAGAEDIWATVCAPACEAQNTFIVTPFN